MADAEYWRAKLAAELDAEQEALVVMGNASMLWFEAKAANDMTDELEAELNEAIANVRRIDRRIQHCHRKLDKLGVRSENHVSVWSTTSNRPTLRARGVRASRDPRADRGRQPL